MFLPVTYTLCSLCVLNKPRLAAKKYKNQVMLLHRDDDID